MIKMYATRRQHVSGVKVWWLINNILDNYISQEIPFISSRMLLILVVSNSNFWRILASNLSYTCLSRKISFNSLIYLDIWWLSY